MNARSKEMRERLAAVEKELARLKKQKRALERERSRDFDPEEWTDPRPAPPEPAAARPETAAPGPREEAPEWGPPPDDAKRERFASYFMTGSLGQSGPQLKRERRAMRNKAIVAALTALFLLFALARFLVN